MLKLFREVKSGFQAAQYKVTMITNSIDAPEPLHKLTSSQLSSWLSHKHYEVSLWKTPAISAVIVSPNHSMTAYDEAYDELTGDKSGALADLVRCYQPGSPS